MAAAAGAATKPVYVKTLTGKVMEFVTFPSGEPETTLVVSLKEMIEDLDGAPLSLSRSLIVG